ncbi:hypothetical protein Q3G72_013791 [Acer saccharum]|nr:hypothetical protein Q3G72_013791 [Acer saccharum]
MIFDYLKDISDDLFASKDTYSFETFIANDIDLFPSSSSLLLFTSLLCRLHLFFVASSLSTFSLPSTPSSPSTTAVASLSGEGSIASLLCRLLAVDYCSYFSLRCRIEKIRLGSMGLRLKWSNKKDISIPNANSVIEY